MISSLSPLIPLSLIAVFAAAEGRTSGPVDGLKDAYAGAFLLGAAIGTGQILGEEPDAMRLAETHFNSVTAENAMKWQHLQPAPGVFDFTAADVFVDWAEARGIHLVGHTLVWHNQTPSWVFEDAEGRPLSREALIERMREHIHTVVGRYRGRVRGWDVVNEAVVNDGSMRETPWYRIIGPDYLALAFTFAHEADPSAELYYNDYSLDERVKRQAVLRLLRGLLEAGVPVHGVGTQEHISVEWPSLADIEAAVVELSSLGLPVMVTELDVDVLPRAFEHSGAEITLSAELSAELNPWPDGLPPARAAQLAERYRDLFGVYYKHRDKISRVTLWGLHDGGSWLNHWPVRGRTSYPLLFDRDLQPKAAFHAVLAVPEARE
jgi:endo-1,4-beta-xylanase